MCSYSSLTNVFTTLFSLTVTATHEVSELKTDDKDYTVRLHSSLFDTCFRLLHVVQMAHLDV